MTSPITTIFRANYQEADGSSEALRKANESPPWRKFGNKESTEGDFEKRTMREDQIRKGQIYLVDEEQARIVDAAILLRRPILVSGEPGVGKTSLAYAIAWQLALGDVLRWSITSQSRLQDALYSYDAITRLNDAALEKNGATSSSHDPRVVGQYITLGPLGTAFCPNKSGPYHPRVVLIDEVDKCDMDLPNDLLHLLEEGEFEIREISRSQKKDQVEHEVRTMDGRSVPIAADGRVQCTDFPIIVMTSNDEREFSPAFHRRCLKLHVNKPDKIKIESILAQHLKSKVSLAETEVQKTVDRYMRLSSSPSSRLSVDRLINAAYLLGTGRFASSEERDKMVNFLLPEDKE